MKKVTSILHNNCLNGKDGENEQIEENMCMCVGDFFIA